MKNIVTKLFVAVALPLIFTLQQSCKRSSADEIKNITVNPAFKDYVEGFTTGPVSTETGIIVRLNFDAVDSAMIEQHADKSLFEFKPSIKGTATWLDAKTIKFQPDKKLPSGVAFEAKFKLSKLIKVPDSLKTLVFGFHTIEQDFEVFIEKSRAYDINNLQKEQLTGVVLTADAADAKDVEKMIIAKQNGKPLPIAWSHDELKRKHTFTVDSINRSEEKSIVSIHCNGRSIGVDKTKILNHAIAPLNEFKITDIRTFRFPEEFILVRFSDPLAEDQEMEGKIQMGKFFNFSYVINFNELYIYPASSINKNEYLSIESSVKNYKNKPLASKYSQLITFQDLSPNVRLLSSGTILPSNNGMLIPFEAVNLKAVDVKITQIYQNNIPQFLQVNDLYGNNQLSRVGRKVLHKTIPLGQIANYNQWNTFHLDISKMIETQPGAIYNVEISFRKEHSTLECNNTENQNYEVYAFYNSAGESYEDNWEFIDYGYDYDWSYSDDYYYYNWNERDNPCSPSYYSGKKVSTNILATDIGLIAKAGEDGEMYVFATDIISAQPMKDVSIEVLNYQLQPMASGTTDAKGMCKLSVKGKPFLIVAQKNKQQSYLKLSDAYSLSLSSFDVSGEYVSKGMKGFMYGERGVWRPGDSLFVTFILEDNLKTLPKDHPVVFEFYNPLGNLIEKRSVTHQLNGFYSFHSATSPDAPTGIYRLTARVGKNQFSHFLRIETIKPNRLKIILDTGNKKIISLADPVDFTIESAWLHGAVAKNLKVECDATFRSIKTSFPNYKDFQFDDPAKAFSSDAYPLFRGVLDEKGKVTFKPTLKIQSTPGFISAKVETRVYEPGGEYSVDYTTINFSPYTSYVGIKAPKTSGDSPYLFTDRNHTFTITNVNENGKPSTNNKVQIETYKLEWQFWWENYENNNSEFMYFNNSELIETKEIELKNGLGYYTINVPNEDWGKYYFRVQDPVSGHTCGLVTFFDWFGYNRFESSNKTSAAMLTMSTDKTSYITGEDIKLTFKAPTGSRAYISIENGSGIIETHQLNEQNNRIEFQTKAKPEMSPNVYLSVVLIQPHANTVNGLPMRLYGVVPVMVENPETKLKPIISAPDIMRPGQNATISVSEATGKPMTYTLAIVDEGLLSLTKYKTPDPHSKFYAKEAIGVRTWDIYDNVIGAWGGKIQRILSIGGDAELDRDAGAQRATRFKPMVKFLGPFALEKGKTASHSIAIPEYVGSARIMVVARQNKAYGNAEKTVTVRSPLMLLCTAPRVIGPGETFRLPVNVFAMEEQIKNVSIQVKTNSMLSINGKNSLQVKFTKTGEQIVYFDLKAADAIGMAKISVTATSGNEKAVWNIEMDVRAANPTITEITEAVIKEGETWEGSYEPIGITGTNENVLEISTFIPMNIDKWLNYLINYPHGCAEQSVSGAFTMLYIDNLSDASENSQKRAETKVKNTIKKIQSLQLSNGGISMWPNSKYADEWVTSYAGHFMIEAQQKGYMVSKQFLNKWKSYQQKQARNWKHNRTIFNNDLMQAYRLYTLSVAGSPEIALMNRLAETSFLTPQAKWILATAYVISGRTDLAKRLIAQTTTAIPSYYEYDYTYGSHLRDKAFILETYLKLGMTNNALSTLKEIADELGKNDWLSTQTVAQSLRSVALFLKINPMGKQMKFSLIRSGKPIEYQSKNMTYTIPINHDSGEKIALQNKGQGTLYARIIRKGIPKESNMQAVQQNLKMNVIYTSQDGKPIQPTTLPQGTIFFAKVTITHPGTLNNYKSMALTQIFPSGWEIMTDRFAFDNQSEQSFTYQDIRDDRVITYFDLPKSQSITITIRLSASYVGTFYMPMVYCEAMYNNNVKALEPGKWVSVITNDNTLMSDAGASR